MAEQIKELIESSSNKEYNKANEIFEELMAEKIGQKLDETRSEISDVVYNGKEPIDEVLGAAGRILSAGPAVAAWIAKNGKKAWNALTKKRESKNL